MQVMEELLLGVPNKAPKYWIHWKIPWWLIMIPNQKMTLKIVWRAGPLTAKCCAAYLRLDVGVVADSMAKGRVGEVLPYCL